MVVCPCGFANPDDATTCLMCALPLETPTATDDNAAAPGNATRSAAPGPASTCAPAADASAPAAAACGAADTLVLENARTRERVRISAPGGIIGRAGDFSPDAFSPQVSGTHLVAEPLASEAGWSLEFIGRNATAVSAGGSWVAMRPGVPHAVFGGEMIKMADMLFRVFLEGSCGPDCADGAAVNTDTRNNAAPADPAAASTAGPAAAHPAAHAAHPDESAPTEGAPTEGARTRWVVRCPVCGTTFDVAGPDARVATCSVCTDPFDRKAIAKAVPLEQRAG